MGCTCMILVRPLTGNGIVERSHCTIKCIAARMQCSIMEAVYWYNVMLKDDKKSLTAPVNATFSYKIRIKSFDIVLVPDNAVSSLYMEGDAVWVKNPYGRCMRQFGEGTVTKINS